MKSEHDRVEELLNRALEFKPEERTAFLAGACGNDVALRQRVETLLVAADAAEGFMKTASTQPGTPVTEGPGTVIGRYKLLQKVGEGGMGVVYMAEQTEPVTRKVALKIIKLGMDTRQVVARFEAERQALALMDHPHIAKVLDAGATDTGRPYFVMELVRGVPITEYCDKNKLTAQQRLELFMPVCQAIQHAHQKGVIHRDIKPSNVMVTLHDGNPVPKVIDFGIAKATNQRLTEKTLFTNYAQMIGTPAYMSPEQAELSGLDVDTRTDVYSLGVLLYELLTGTTPFPTQELLSLGYGEMQKVIAEKEPPKPSTRLSTMQDEERTAVARNRSIEIAALGSLFQGDMDWIVMKALEKDRTRRYETVNGLVSDIKRHLKNEPVSAAAPTFGYQVQKFYRRNRGYMRAAAVVAGLLIVAAATATFQAVKATRQRQRAEAAQAAAIKARDAAERAKVEAGQARSLETEHRQRVETAERTAQARLYAADMNLAHAAIQAGNQVRAGELLERHVPSQVEEDLRGWEWRYLWQQVQSDALYSLPKFSSGVKALDLSPDGRRVVIGLMDGRSFVWDLERRVELRALTPESGEPAQCFFSADGSTLIVACAAARQGLLRWNARTFEELAPLPFPEPEGELAINQLAVSPDDRYVAARIFWDTPGISWKYSLVVWDVAVARSLRVQRERFNAVCFGADGDQLFASVFDLTHGSSIRTLLASSEDIIEEWPAIDEPLAILDASANRKWVASASDPSFWNGSGSWDIQLWNADSGAMSTLTGHRRWINALEFSADGTTLASASGDATVRIWDLESLSVRAILRGHQDEVLSLSLSRDGKLVVTGGKDGVVSVWSTTPRANPGQHLSRSFATPGLGWFHSGDGQHLFVRSLDQPDLFESIELDPLTLEDRGSTKGESVVPLLMFSPDSPWVVGIDTSDGEGSPPAMAIYDLETRRFAKRLDYQIFPLTFLPVEKQLVGVEWNQDFEKAKLIFLDVESWEPTARPLPGPIRDAWFGGTMSCSGEMVALGYSGRPGLLSLFRLSVAEGFQSMTEFQAHTEPIRAMAFAPNRRLMATASESGVCILWDMENWTRTGSVRGQVTSHQAGALGDMTFSPDSRRLVMTGAGGGGLKLWDTATLQEVITLSVDGVCTQPWFLNNGNTLVATSWNGRESTLHVWRAPSREEIEASEAAKKRGPSEE